MEPGALFYRLFINLKRKKNVQISESTFALLSDWRPGLRIPDRILPPPIDPVLSVLFNRQMGN